MACVAGSYGMFLVCCFQLAAEQHSSTMISYGMVLSCGRLNLCRKTGVCGVVLNRNKQEACLVGYSEYG